LDDVESLNKQRFYEPPDQEQGPAEVFLVRDGKQRGHPFEGLGMAQKVQVFSDYLDLEKYEAAGISYRQINQVFSNLAEGKPRSEWLEGTGLPDPDRKLSLGALKRQTVQQQDQQRQSSRKGRDNGMDR